MPRSLHGDDPRVRTPEVGVAPEQKLRSHAANCTTAGSGAGAYLRFTVSFDVFFTPA